MSEDHDKDQPKKPAPTTTPTPRPAPQQPGHREQANEHKTTDWIKPPPDKKK
ncbi:hypothetical protein [Tardiphaga sp.]|uniref:hypothetical protein n=1 Tax=Tardiphaga sp. TaxID=1926292 RepID=UPI00260507E5|nr:hypothetical protein [Tardiphaga sp.]